MTHLKSSTTAQLTSSLQSLCMSTPSIQTQTIRTFSSTASQCARKIPRKGNRDSNRQRGISAVHQYGRPALGVDKSIGDLPNPRPRRQHQKLTRNFVRENFPETHGLDGFFKDRMPILTADKEEVKGHSWPYPLLAIKSFDDLHALYWKCHLEVNQVRTRRMEFKRRQPGYGLTEVEDRLRRLKVTQKNILQVLFDRSQVQQEINLMQQTGTSLAELGERVGVTQEQIEDMYNYRQESLPAPDTTSVQ